MSDGQVLGHILKFVDIIVGQHESPVVQALLVNLSTGRTFVEISLFGEWVKFSLKVSGSVAPEFMSILRTPYVWYT